MITTITLPTNKYRMARRCDVTGKGMNEGYVFINEPDLYYACNEEAAKQYVTSLGYNWGDEMKKINTAEEWFSWAKWEQVDPNNFFDPSGNQWDLNKVMASFNVVYKEIKNAVTEEQTEKAYKKLELLIILNERELPNSE